MQILYKFGQNGEFSSIPSLGFWLGYCAKSHDAPLSSQPRNKGEGEGFRVLGLGVERRYISNWGRRGFDDERVVLLLFLLCSLPFPLWQLS